MTITFQICHYNSIPNMPRPLPSGYAMTTATYVMTAPTYAMTTPSHAMTTPFHISQLHVMTILPLHTTKPTFLKKKRIK